MDVAALPAIESTSPARAFRCPSNSPRRELKTYPHIAESSLAEATPSSWQGQSLSQGLPQSNAKKSNSRRPLALGRDWISRWPTAIHAALVAVRKGPRSHLEGIDPFQEPLGVLLSGTSPS